MANGKMTGGLAFIAGPAEYRSSGVMAFIVAEYGVVYQKDLSARTAEVAKAMTVYERDASWHQAE